MSRKFTHPALMLMFLAASSVGAAPRSISLQPAASGDLESSSLVRLRDQKQLVNHNAERVAFGQTLAAPAAPGAVAEHGVAIDKSQPMAAAPIQVERQPFIGRSRHFSLNVQAEELLRGVQLPLSSPGALVKIQPLALPNTEVVNPERLLRAWEMVLQGTDGRVLASNDAFELVLGPGQLSKSEGSLPPGTSVFRIRPEVGQGAVLLKTLRTDLAGAYRIHVLEKSSPVELRLQANRSSYLLGQSLQVRASLPENLAGARLEKTEGYLLAPSGQRIPLELQADGAAFSAQTTPEMAWLGQGRPGELWQAVVASEGTFQGTPFLREVRTAFAITAPTARLTGPAAWSRSEKGMDVAVEVQVASAGRYEVQALLVGKDKATEVERAGYLARTADWLRPGTQSLVLEFDLQAAGIEGPYQIQDLRLLDQSRLGLLHRQAHALTIQKP